MELAGKVNITPGDLFLWGESAIDHRFGRSSSS